MCHEFSAEAIQRDQGQRIQFAADAVPDVKESKEWSVVANGE